MPIEPRNSRAADSPSQQPTLLPGDPALRKEVIGEMLNACRAYLIVVASAEMSRDVAIKVAPSDVVQDTLFEAHLGFDGFRGQTRDELLAWLRRILRNNMLNATRRYRETSRRNLALEVRLAGGSAVHESGMKLADPWPGPSSEFFRNEAEQSVVNALSRLPAIYQQVIDLRNRENLSFAEVGHQLGRTEEAARKLWARAIELLRAEIR